MSRPFPPAEIASEVWRASRLEGSVRALILDVDGTLAPIAPTPDRARVPPDTLRSLSRLVARRWRIAVVSGRAASDAARLVPIEGVAIFGCHGAEGPGASALDPSEAATVSSQLRTLGRRALRLMLPFPQVRLELKPYGLAFHDRALSARSFLYWRDRLTEWLRQEDLSGLEVIPGRRVVELRPAGVSKRAVVEGWAPLGGSQRCDDSLVVAGDDRTDEEMFLALGPRGLSIRVGSSAEATHARRRVANPAAFAAFLSRLAVLDERGGP